MKRLLCVLLTALLIIPTLATASFAEEAKKISFTDVDSATARGQAIIKLAEAGVLLGYPDGTFKPDQPITRGELSKVINKIFNYTEADTEMFPDVDKTNDWYYNEVAIAKKAGYIKGYEDGTFRGENNMTREEACTILTRVGGLYDLGLPVNIKDAVSEWAVPFVNTVIISGFMAVEEGETFRATEKITRGEFCEAFSKFVKAEAVVPPAEDKKEDSKEDNNKEDNKTSNITSNSGTSNSGTSNNTGSGNNSSTGNGGVDVVDPPAEDPPAGDIPEENLPEEDPPEELPNYEEINAEEVENLTNALTDIENFYAVKDYEEKLVEITSECINIVLGYADKEEITEDFVNDVCKTQIKEAREVWKNMSVDDRNSFIATAVPEFHAATVEWLSNFFGIAAP